jgi:hypothetical protein
MPTPHKYADVIKAWADGHEVQFSADGRPWQDITEGKTPVFFVSDYRSYQWRVKPQKKKGWMYVSKTHPVSAGHGGFISASKEAAQEYMKRYSGGRPIALIEIEYEEGQGL